MAQFIRSVKSGGDGTTNELEAYKIRVVYQDVFEMPNLPLAQPTINPDVLTALTPGDAVQGEVYELFRTTDLAMATAPAEESAVEELLRALGYTRTSRILRTLKSQASRDFWREHTG
jgi:hypothetical protein